MGTVLTYNGMTFTNNNILSGNLTRTQSPICAELSYDTFDVVIYDESGEGVFLQDVNGVLLADTNGVLLQGFGQSAPADYKNYVRGTVGRLTQDGEYIGEFYINSVDRLSKYQWELHFISALGLLDTIPHRGGVYTGEEAGNIINSIMGGTYDHYDNDEDCYYYTGTIPYRIEGAVKETVVNGWLPYSTSSRSNLQQVLFSTGASLIKDSVGIKFCYWQPSDTTDIPDNRMYIDGKSVEYQSKPTSVVVTEHQYRSTIYDRTEELYSESVTPVTNKLIIFNEPYYSLNPDADPEHHITIVSSGANFAIISGTGTLTGKKYMHNTKTVIKEISSVTGEENAFTVSDAYLVSSANSNNVAERVASYYVDAEKVNYGMVVEGDAILGDRIRFTDPFGETVTGYICSENIELSGVMKSRTQIVTNWQPNHTGNEFNHYVILKNVGEKFTPTEAQVGTTAKLIVFGGFEGGSGGGGSTNGTGGLRITVPSHTSGNVQDGANGEAGDGGEAGNSVMINEQTITLAAQDYELTAVGAGGVGGAGGAVGQEGSDGQLGGITICAGYSSQDGVLLTTGYANPLNGDVYGEKGIDGCDGGEIEETITYFGNTWYAGESGADVSYSESGQDEQGRWISFSGTSRGSKGSGAYYGHDGTNGNSGRNWSASGADGISATTPANATAAGFGKCGNGGHGANAPSGGGGAYFYNGFYETAWVQQGTAGLGAGGSNGSNGSQGFALILYN